MSMNLKDRAVAYAGGIKTLFEWTITGAVVDPEHAQKRADVCTGRLSGEKCPMNVSDWKVTELISLAVKRHIELKSKLNLRVKRDRKLFTCAGCGCPLKTLVWQEFETINPDESEREKLWPKCWKLSESP